MVNPSVETIADTEKEILQMYSFPFFIKNFPIKPLQYIQIQQGFPFGPGQFQNGPKSLGTSQFGTWMFEMV